MIDKLLENKIKDSSRENEVAVLLSGGVDSLSVAFTAHRLGKKVHAYTFCLENNPTYDSQKAIDASNIMGWRCTKVEVPINNLIEDFHTLRTKFACIKKTHYECTFPFLYVYPKIEEKEVISGWAADGYYGVSKKACIHYKEPKELFDQFRIEYFGNSNPVAYMQQQYLCLKYKKDFIAPYLDSTIKDFFMQYDWYQLNKPYQKHHVIEAFPEFQKIGKPKPHINLQLGAGIDKAFEVLLECKDINIKNRKRMLDVYRDWKNYGEIRTLYDC